MTGPTRELAEQVHALMRRQIDLTDELDATKRVARQQRDALLQGHTNPSLPATLDDPQAPGFSGTPVDPDSWRCPLHVHPPLNDLNEEP